MRLTDLLQSFGAGRIIGVDQDFRNLAQFEKRGGLASSLDNVYANASVVLITPDYSGNFESHRIPGGQLVLDFSSRHLDPEALRPGNHETIYPACSPHPAVLLPGLCQGFSQGNWPACAQLPAVAIIETLLERSNPPQLLPLPGKNLNAKIAACIQKATAV